MRQIGKVKNKEHHRILRAYLESQQIATGELGEVEGVIWIQSEDDLARAKLILDEFLQNPSDAKYRIALRLVGGRASSPSSQSKKVRSWKRLAARTKSPTISWTIGILSLCVFLLQAVDRQQVVVRWLMFSLDHAYPILGLPKFMEIRSGEVWRLVTPIFLHFGWLHILFNLYWLHQLSPSIEMYLGWGRFTVLVLAIAVISHCGFYLLVGKPFGGLSGVIYGLVGFMYIVNRFHHRTTLALDAGLIRVFVFFYVLSWFLTVIGMGVANTIHGLGAVVGIGFGFLTADSSAAELWRRASQSRRREYLMNMAILFALLVGSVVIDKFA